jgi:hypothetical protein
MKKEGCNLYRQLFELLRYANGREANSHNTADWPKYLTDLENLSGAFLSPEFSPRKRTLTAELCSITTSNKGLKGMGSYDGKQTNRKPLAFLEVIQGVFPTLSLPQDYSPDVLSTFTSQPKAPQCTNKVFL